MELGLRYQRFKTRFDGQCFMNEFRKLLETEECTVKRAQMGRSEFVSPFVFFDLPAWMDFVGRFKT